jgi:hypothetical protein
MEFRGAREVHEDKCKHMRCADVGSRQSCPGQEASPMAHHSIAMLLSGKAYFLGREGGTSSQSR